MYKIDVLLKQDQKVFHTQDLALLWGIINKNTLYTTIKRYLVNTRFSHKQLSCRVTTFATIEFEFNKNFDFRGLS